MATCCYYYCRQRLHQPPTSNRKFEFDSLDGGPTDLPHHHQQQVPKRGLHQGVQRSTGRPRRDLRHLLRLLRRATCSPTTRSSAAWSPASPRPPQRGPAPRPDPQSREAGPSGVKEGTGSRDPHGRVQGGFTAAPPAPRRTRPGSRTDRHWQASAKVRK